MTMYESEMAARVAANEKSREMEENWDTVEFDGHNCADVREDYVRPCSGWDGNSKRCECGNRRVGWAFSEYSKGVWTFYAEAY